MKPGQRYQLAQELNNSGHPGKAIIELSHVLAADKHHNAAARTLSFLFSQYRLRDMAPLNPDGLLAALEHGNVDSRVLGAAALQYLKSHTAFAGLFVRGQSGDWAGAARDLLTHLKDDLDAPLLLAVLSNTENTDGAFERLLTEARKALLLEPQALMRDNKKALVFVCALIRQLHINEYVFAVSDGERQRLKEIPLDLAAVLEGQRPAATDLCLRALYAPLDALLGEPRKKAAYKKITPPALRKLVVDLMTARLQESARAANIEAIDSAPDATSTAVAALYEQNPYPRWHSLHTSPEGARRRQMAEHFDAPELDFFERPFRTLIAGCGTGQQAVDAAIGYGAHAHVTAIDLSRASLAYASLQAEKFKISNVTFRLCDILGVAALDETFDVIESVGVLHHMADPLEGWRRLVDRLAPGGVMKIGLYSAAARKPIAALRDAIGDSGIGDDENAIRNFRAGVMAGGVDADTGFLLQSADFYSLSNVRDLLFHVSERHLDLHEIEKFLADNNLVFRGFQLPADIADGAPTGDAAYDLDAWRGFEAAHPDTFKGMYVFWCSS